MKSKNKFFAIIILCFLIGGFFISTKKDAPTVSNITISYADSIFFPEVSKKETEYGLVNLTSLPTIFTIDLRYSSKNNFAGKEFYPKIAKAYLLESTAKKLMNANEEFYKMGYRIKILDAYRPKRYQYILRKAAAEINPNTQNFVADPETGSHHNRGASIDITLTDLEGHELNMPTSYDYFGPEASINYNGCTEEQKNNREILGTIMEKHGFRRISSEWWHFDDIDFRNYPLLDVDFSELYE